MRKYYHRLSVCTDPTELRCFAVKGYFEYEPREWASVWIAREMNREDAELLVRAYEAERDNKGITHAS
jgi:hypothetical protein